MTTELETTPSIRPEAIELPPTFSIDITYWAMGEATTSASADAVV
ncbi:MAG TPA: hypothetical protein VIJ76_01995 [Galbitalea sp.]